MGNRSEQAILRAQLDLLPPSLAARAFVSFSFPLTKLLEFQSFPGQGQRDRGCT